MKDSLDEAVAKRRALVAREVAAGLKPVAYPTRDGWVLLARSTCDGWRAYVFDAAGPVGDYGPAPLTQSEHEGLLRTALEFGADLSKPTDPRTVQ